MKSLLLSALALTVASTSVPALAKRDSGMKSPAPRAVSGGPRHNWGGKHNGRWIGGWRAPGGWGAYRPAIRGYVLPGYWINPSFYIGNYARYGLAAPAPGYGWSRYYDDAVLTDSAGHIYDSVRGIDWDSYDEYRDDPRMAGADFGEDYEDSWGYRDDRRAAPPARGKDRDGGLGGALVGGAVGAIGGAAIAGRGDRLAGALIGGGVGAVAGAAIDQGDRYGRGPTRGRPGLSYDDDGYDRYDDYADRHDDRRYDTRPRPPRGPYRYPAPHPYPHVTHHYGHGWGGGVTTITVHSQPVVTTTTVTTEEVVYAAAPRKRIHKRVWKPRPKVHHKPRCVC